MNLIKPVRYLGELGLQKVLLRCEHFEVICITMFHQQLCVPHRSLKVEDLLLVELDPLLGCLPESDGVVHLYSRFEKTLPELPFCGCTHETEAMAPMSRIAGNFLFMICDFVWIIRVQIQIYFISKSLVQHFSSFLHLIPVLKLKNMKKSFIAIAAVCCLATGCEAGMMDGYYDGGVMAPSAPDQEMVQPAPGGDNYSDYQDNPFIKTADENVSTFSVDADGASYANMRRFITEGSLPYGGAVRIEEFLNYFTFDYADPTDDNTVAINAEVGACPWTPDHRLMRLGIKGRSLEASEIPDANFVFLIDVSGSMNSNDKLGLLKEGLKTLVDQLRPTDRISIITYSGKVNKLLESTLVSEADGIKKAISKLVASGSTAGGEALKMAYEEALANYIEGGNNRVVMGTDGDFNVGVTSTDALVEMVQDYASKGIYMTVCGFGRGNLNDSMMESISNNGNGNYEYIATEDDMTKVFVNERSEFFAVANDAKIQVTFDASKVESYRLIGYENRVLSNEDFENDEKDAGEIGAGQTITALYEIVPVSEEALAEGPLAVFDFRYKKSLGAESIPLTLDVAMAGEASPELSFAAGVAAYGMILRDSPYKGDATFDMAYELAENGLSFDPFGYRADFVDIIKAAKRIAE